MQKKKKKVPLAGGIDLEKKNKVEEQHREIVGSFGICRAICYEDC